MTPDAQARAVVETWVGTIQDPVDYPTVRDADALIALMAAALIQARREAWEEAIKFVRNAPYKLAERVGRETPGSVINVASGIAMEMEMYASEQALRQQGERD